MGRDEGTALKAVQNGVKRSICGIWDRRRFWDWALQSDNLVQAVASCESSSLTKADKWASLLFSATRRQRTYIPQS
jgi:hypothetical protein